MTSDHASVLSEISKMSPSKTPVTAPLKKRGSDKTLAGVLTYGKKCRVCAVPFYFQIPPTEPISKRLCPLIPADC